MTRLSITLFGGFAVTLDGEPVTGFDSNKVRALLAYLAVESGRAHRRESLAALLWPGYPDRSARTNLRNALANLRTAIGDRDAEPPFLLITRETLQFNRESDHWCDAALLEDALSSAQGVPTDQLAEVADLHTGDFLAGFTLEDAVGFDDWASVTRGQLRRQASDLLGTLVERIEAEDNAERAITFARRRVELEPWDESAQRQLIRLLADTGRRGAALRQYRECVRVLEEELGAEATAETVALYEELRVRARARVSGDAEMPPTSVASRPTASRPPAFLDDTVEPVIADRPVFVGREPELARLDGYLDAALSGQGQVAFVVGGPGRGKSALLRAFAAQAMAAHPDLLVVSGACNATSGVGDAYLPFREAVGMLTGDVESRWRAGRVSRDHAHRLWSALPKTLPALVAHGPYVIGSFVSGSGVISRVEQAGLGDAPWVPELRTLASRSAVSGLEQQALFQQVTNTLQAVAAEHPLLLVVDDLQWIDQGSIGLLFHLARRLSGSWILLVGAYRPEEVAAGRTGGGTSEPHPLTKTLNELRRDFGDVWIDLRQADQSEGRQFVDALVATEDNRLGDGFRAALYERTGGHPLFTIELLRAMQVRGDLLLDADGAWVEGESLDWTTLPARVEAVIEERLNRLTAQQRDLLTVASVEGETFTAQVVARVQGLSERETLHMLSRDLAAGHRLVREAEGVSVAGGYLSRSEFVHALFQEHLYRELSEGERRLLHGEVADVLEDVYGEFRDRVAVRLAYHYDQAGNREKTIEYATRAGELARTAYADDEAIRHYELALGGCTASNAVKSDASWRLAALSGLGKLYYRQGEVSRSEGYLRQAIALGCDIGLDPQRLVVLYYWLGDALWWQSRYEEQCLLGEEGLLLVADSPRSLGAALMNQMVACAVGCMGDLERFKALIIRTAEFFRDLPHVEESASVYPYFILVCLSMKDTKGVVQWVAALEEKATQHGDLVGLASAHRYAADYLAELGSFRLAIERQQKQLQTIARAGDMKFESWALGDLARLYWATGDAGNAAQCAEKALELRRIVGFKRDIADGLCMVGRVELCQGLWSRAIERCRDAALLYEVWDRPSGPSLARYLLGRAYLGAGQQACALRSFSEGLQALPEVQEARTPSSIRHLLSGLLSGLEEAYADAAAYLDWCERSEAQEPWFANWALQLYLAPVEGQAMNGPLPLADDFTVLSPDWLWIDPFGDCEYQAGSGLVISAANGRDLWYINRSAPRLMRDVPSGAGGWIVQIGVEPALDDRPAIGGLLLWRGKRDYLWLEIGRFGRRDIAFGGCLDNKDLVIGRGRLPEGPAPGWAMGEWVTLRLELTGDHVDALCSLGGEQWYSVGHTAFPVDDTVQVGVHAMGMIDRTIYHGAYPEGTAIRFTDFRLWGT